MTKVTDLTTRALRASGISDWQQPPNAEDQAVAVDLFNEWMHALPERGVDITHTTQTASGTFALDPRWEGCVVRNLTVLLCSEAKKPVAPLIEREARQLFALMRRAYRPEAGVTIDTALTRNQMPTTTARWRF